MQVSTLDRLPRHTEVEEPRPFLGMTFSQGSHEEEDPFFLPLDVVGIPNYNELTFVLFISRTEDSGPHSSLWFEPFGVSYCGSKILSKARNVSRVLVAQGPSGRLWRRPGLRRSRTQTRVSFEDDGVNDAHEYRTHVRVGVAWFPSDSKPDLTSRQSSSH